MRPDQRSKMFAQVIEGGTTAERRSEMDAIVREELIPALHEEPGFTGALNLVNRDSGEAMMIVLWETRGQAELPIGDRGPAFLRALGSIVTISTGQRRPISTWDVNAQVMVPAQQEVPA